MAGVRHSTKYIEDASSPDSLTPPDQILVARFRRPYRHPATDGVWHVAPLPFMSTKPLTEQPLSGHARDRGGLSASPVCFRDRQILGRLASYSAGRPSIRTSETMRA